MLRRGFRIEKAGSDGPEFNTEIDGRRFWFEAIAPTAGTGPDQVPDLKVGFVPTEQVLMRYTAALAEKRRKYEEYLAKGMISADDGYVVAINANKVPNAFFGSLLPFHISAYLPFGAYTVAINPKTQQRVGDYFQCRDCVQKQSGGAVSTAAFLDPEYKGISAVLVGLLDVAGYTRGTAENGSDFDVLHNPIASVSLPREALPWCRNQYVNDGELETVEQSM
jgi:hypothetical protein